MTTTRRPGSTWLFWLVMCLALMGPVGPAQAAPTILSTLGPLGGHAVVCYCTGCSTINGTVHGNVLVGCSACLGFGPNGHVDGTVTLVGTGKTFDACACPKITCRATAICGKPCASHPCHVYVGKTNPVDCPSVCNEVHTARAVFEGLSPTAGCTTLDLHFAHQTIDGSGDACPVVFDVTNVCLDDASLTFCGGPTCQFVIVDSGCFRVDQSSIKLRGGVTPCDVVFCMEAPCPVIECANVSGIFIQCGCSRNFLSVDPATIHGEVISSGLDLGTDSQIFGPAVNAAPEIDPRATTTASGLMLAVLAVVLERRVRRR